MLNVFTMRLRIQISLHVLLLEYYATREMICLELMDTLYQRQGNIMLSKTIRGINSVHFLLQ